MRTAVDILVPVLAESEPSKVPFYLLGGVLAGWAVLLATIGITQPDFPGSAARARAVMGISAVLVVATMASAVLTATKHEGAHEAEASEPEGEEPAKEPAPSGGGATVQITADPSGQLKYEQASATAKAGSVKIDFDNPSPVQHDVTIEAGGGSKLGGTKVVANGKASATVDLKAGSYTFYCSVDAHRQAGMQGKLSVG